MWRQPKGWWRYRACFIWQRPPETNHGNGVCLKHTWLESSCLYMFILIIQKIQVLIVIVSKFSPSLAKNQIQATATRITNLIVCTSAAPLKPTSHFPKAHPDFSAGLEVNVPYIKPRTDKLFCMFFRKKEYAHEQNVHVYIYIYLSLHTVHLYWRIFTVCKLRSIHTTDDIWYLTTLCT